MNDKKLLALDIEWAPTKAYVWRAWDENIAPEQIIEDGGMLCFCAHWIGDKDYHFFSAWDDGKAGMAEAALILLTEADAVITFNGDRYDLPKIIGEIVLAGLTPPPPITSIDCIKTVKKMGFFRSSLAYVGPLLTGSSKLKHEGFRLWKDTLDGDTKAQTKMRKYCIQDVRLLAKLYERIKPFIKNHPFMGTTKHECGACGSNHVQSRGVRRTKSFIIQRLQCQNCGSWQEGTRKKVS